MDASRTISWLRAPASAPLMLECRVVSEIERRDLGIRLAAIVLMAAICAYLGLFAFAAAFLAINALFMAAQRRFGRALDQHRPLSRAGAAAYGLLAHVLMLVYLAPGVVLAMQEGLMAHLIALCWLTGILINCANNLAGAPRFFFLQMLPAMGAFLGAAALIGLRVEPVDPLLLGAYLAGVGMVAFNFVELTSRRQETYVELRAARSALEARLREKEREMRRDPLTGLWNRAAFKHHATQLLEDDPTGERRAGLAIGLIDLNGFKAINDTYGHEAGDAVLIGAAAAFQRTLESRGAVARLGGDEFAVALWDAPSAQAARALGEEIVAAADRPIAYQNRALHFGASIGLVRVAEHADWTISDLLHAADLAMFAAKQTPPHVALYAARSMGLQPPAFRAEELEAALESGAFEPLYQPKVQLRTGAIVGFEALARWRHPALGLLAPERFLESLEASRLTPKLTDRMLDAVIADLDQLDRDGAAPVRIAINAPAAVLRDADMSRRFAERIAETPKLANRLTIDVATRLLDARGGDAKLDALARLKGLGAEIALDDFGADRACIELLGTGLFDEVKIDAALVHRLERDGPSAHLIRGLATIAEGYGVAVTAEAVETEAQSAALAACGCGFGQGFFYGEHGDLAAMRAALHRGEPAETSEDGALRRSA